MTAFDSHADRADLIRLIALFALTGYDVGSTAYALTHLGAIEMNPLVATTMGTAGVGLALALRFVVGLLLAGGLYAVRNHPDNRWGHGPMVVAIVLLALVAVWNTAVIATAINSSGAA